MDVQDVQDGFAIALGVASNMCTNLHTNDLHSNDCWWVVDTGAWVPAFAGMTEQAFAGMTG